SSESVKPYFSGLFTLSSRHVCVFVVTTEAHYRDFCDTGNSYFKKTSQPLTYRPKQPDSMFYWSTKEKRGVFFTSFYLHCLF
ncbi:hypothetical protein, partial [Xenorhabdus miraniensis]|uniref:hypothetical protein n=1 Tax=Xenorhabdus miraniensis TaxID=351674 RepID=UPI001ABFBFCF